MRYLIWGLGKSGIACLELLNDKKNKIYIYDDNLEVINEFSKKIEKNSKITILEKLERDFFYFIDTVVISPAISIKNNLLVFAKSIGVEVISELELGFRYSKNKIVAVTGTNGKTTTVELIYSILKRAGKRVSKVGNIGTPLSSVVKNKKKDILVCEVSSFQLEGTKNFSPNISCLLNITPDHLNRHSFEEYKKLKYKIFNSPKRKNVCVINENLDSSKLNNVYVFGNKKHKNGAYIDGNVIFFTKNNRQKEIINKNQIKLIGNHNLQNVLCAIIVAKLLKIRNKYIKLALKDFKASKHRLELVFEHNSMKFYDDSKATNIDATLQAVNSIKGETILILGGSDKGYDYSQLLANLPENIIKIYAVGQVREKILNSYNLLNLSIKIETYEKLCDAVFSACKELKENQNLLLSPASASFDEFKSYKERGEKFLTYIKDFYNEDKS